MSGGVESTGKGSTVRDRVGDRHRVRVRAVLRVALRTGRRWVRRGCSMAWKSIRRCVGREPEDRETPTQAMEPIEEMSTQDIPQQQMNIDFKTPIDTSVGLDSSEPLAAKDLSLVVWTPKHNLFSGLETLVAID